jgi:MFS family permease
VRPYADLLRVPLMAPLFAATVLARLPVGINGLAVVLFLRTQTGSFAVAGAAAGALALGAGIGAPVAARLIDALGPRVLLALAGGHAAALVALVALGAAQAPDVALVGVSGIAGLLLPPVSSVMRTLYPRVLGHSPALLQSAFALDSVLTEILFVLGPLLVALFVAVADAGAALVASAVAVAAGTTLFLVVLPAVGEEERAEAHAASAGPLGALRSPGIRTLVLAMLPVGFAFGAIEVAIPAFADSEGRPELAGVLLAVWSVASVAGGLAYGARPRRAPLTAVHLRMAALLPFGLLPVALATSPAVMALLVLPAGIFIAPLLATRNELAGRVAPPGSTTEAVTWPLTALVSGIALGAASAGALIDASGWRAAALAGIAAAFVGALISVGRRATLRAPAAAPA